MDLPLTVALDYLMHAMEKEKEQAVWDLWSRLYPFMVAGFVKYRGFNDFQKVLTSPVQRMAKAPEEIEDEMLRVVAAYEGR